MYHFLRFSPAGTDSGSRVLHGFIDVVGLVKGEVFEWIIGLLNMEKVS
jgi:hypothetical protein